MGKLLKAFSCEEKPWEKKQLLRNCKSLGKPFLAKKSLGKRSNCFAIAKALGKEAIASQLQKPWEAFSCEEKPWEKKSFFASLLLKGCWEKKQLRCNCKKAFGEKFLVSRKSQAEKPLNTTLA
jgi:hypothetical protein